MEFSTNKFQDRASAYPEILSVIKNLLEGETDLIANLANISALLMSELRVHWVGFYRVTPVDLILGPFQGPLACTRIPFSRGVCGFAYRQKNTVIVPDVHKFEGHIPAVPYQIPKLWSRCLAEAKFSCCWMSIAKNSTILG